MKHKITPAIVDYIKAQRNAGVRWCVLAKDTGLPFWTLYRCVNGEIHYCKICGDNISSGEYCFNNIECRRERHKDEVRRHSDYYKQYRLNHKQYFHQYRLNHKSPKTEDKRKGSITVNLQREDYIRRAVNAGRSYSHVGRELKISPATVRCHYLGEVKTHSCVVCRDIIKRGKYCRKRACQNIYQNKLYAKRPDIRVKTAKSFKAWRDSHPNYKAPGKECICSTCGRTFLRYRPAQGDGENTYCSSLCYFNRAKVKAAISRRIENITVLSKVIVKEAPVPDTRVESIGSLMRKAPESEEHMK